MRPSLTIACLLGATVLVAQRAGLAAPEEQSDSRMRIDPTEIVVGLFYGGTTLHLDAAVPAGLEVAVVCVGQEERVELKRKGKVGRILWINVGDAVFDRVPSFYQLTTSGSLAELAPASVLQKLGVGYGALEARAVQAAGDEDGSRLFRELVRLKESEQLFSEQQGGVSLEATAHGSTHVSARCFLPDKVPMGSVEVRLFGFSQGRGSLLDSRRVRLRQGGLTAFISSLAVGHGLLYGILAVFVAVIVGLLTGFVFGSGSRRGH
jgi:uncharacterized protein (TIGR02186 family)